MTNNKIQRFATEEGSRHMLVIRLIDALKGYLQFLKLLR